MKDYPLPNSSIDLSGQVALVTGASSGLGRRFAQVLAACGASVAIAARRLDRLDELSAEIAARGGRALPIEMDAADAGSLIGAVALAEQAYGPVTILVNNAGIPDAMRAHKMPVELIDSVLAVNLRAPYILSCEVARRLMAAGQPGRIVNISSSSHFHYDGGGAALYATTKSAIVRMTETLATEWAANHINVNAIAPGAFMTEMMEGMVSRVGDFSPSFRRKRFGDPAQLDSTLLYLVSPASDFVTGATIRVDDGQI